MGSEEGNRPTTEVMSDGIVLDEGAKHHERTGEGAGETDAHLVEDNPREEEHEQEDIDKTAGSGEETIVRGCPTQTTLTARHFQQRLQRRHHIVDEIAHHHGSSHDEEHCPSCDGRIVEPFRSAQSIRITLIVHHYLSDLPNRIAGQTAAQFFEDLTVYFTEHDGGMHLTVAK